MPKIFRQRGIVISYFEGKRELLTKVHETLELARQLYPKFTLRNSDIPVVFFAKGTTAGMAKWEGSDENGYVYNIELNALATKKDFNHIFNETIPHEIAHIVDHFIYKKSNHGATWKKIARSLGCKGKRCHGIKLEKARKHKKYLYVASCGTRIKVGSHVHKKIQDGEIRVITRTRGRLTSQHYTGRIE